MYDRRGSVQCCGRSDAVDSQVCDHTAFSDGVADLGDTGRHSSNTGLIPSRGGDESGHSQRPNEWVDIPRIPEWFPAEAVFSRATHNARTNGSRPVDAAQRKQQSKPAPVLACRAPASRCWLVVCCDVATCVPIVPNPRTPVGPRRRLCAPVGSHPWAGWLSARLHCITVVCPTLLLSSARQSQLN
jgi:hypothetical protein